MCLGGPVGLEAPEGEDQDFDSQQGSVAQCLVDAQNMFGHYHDSISILACSLLGSTERTLTWISHFFSIHSFYCMCRVQNVTLEVTEIWGWRSVIWGQCGSTRSPLQCQVEQTPRSCILVFSQQAEKANNQKGKEAGSISCNAMLATVSQRATEWPLWQVAVSNHSRVFLTLTIGVQVYWPSLLAAGFPQ